MRLKVYKVHRISVPLNRQQLELIDRTIAQGVAAGRAELLKLALRELMARHAALAAPARPAEPPR